MLLISSVMTIWLLSGVFCVLAIIRLWKGDFTIEADTMLYIASAGVVINIMYVKLHLL